MIERYPVAHIFGRAAIDFFDLHEREIFFPLFGRANRTFHHIAGLQAEQLDLRLRYIHVVGRRKVIVIRRTEEPISVGHHFQNADTGQYSIEIIRFFNNFRLGGSDLLIVLIVIPGIVLIIPVLRNKCALSPGDEPLFLAMWEKCL